MIGRNEMKFNQATMIEAVQCYLEKIMKEPVPIVKEVTSSSYDSYTEFSIKVESQEE